MINYSASHSMHDNEYADNIRQLMFVLNKNTIYIFKYIYVHALKTALFVIFV